MESNMNGEVVTIDPNTNCTSCLRAYGDVRGRVPRMLPCYHTYCERCVWKHTRWNSVRCPECETKHPAQHGPEAFPVNLQILEYIGRMIQSGYQMVEPPPGTQPVTPKSAAMAIEDVFWTEEIDYDPPPKLAAQKIREAILDKPWIPQTAFKKNPANSNSPKKGNIQRAAADDGVLASSTPLTPQRKPQAVEPRGQLQTSKISPVTPVKAHAPNRFSPDQLPQIRILDDEARPQHGKPEDKHRDLYQDLDETVMSRYPNTHHNHESRGVPGSVGSWDNQMNHNHGTHAQHQTRDVNNGSQQRGLKTDVPPNQVQKSGKIRDNASNSNQIRNNAPPNQNGYDHDHQFHQHRQHPDVEHSAMRRSLERDFNRQSPGDMETPRNQPPVDLNADDWFKKRLDEDIAAGTVPRVTVLADTDHSVNEDINLGHRNHMDHHNLGRQDHKNHHDGRRHDTPEVPKSNVSKTLVSPSDNKENIPRCPPMVPKTIQHKGNEVQRRPVNSGQENIPSTNTRSPAQNQNVVPNGPKEIPPTVKPKPMVPNNKTSRNLLNQSGEVTVIRPPRILDHEKREPPKVQWGQSKQERNITTTKPPLPTEMPVHSAQVPTKVPVPAQRQNPTTKPPEVRKAKSEELLRRPKKVRSREARELGDNPENMEDFFMENLLKDATSGVERDGVVWSDRVGVIRKPKKGKGKGRNPDMHDGNLSQGLKREIPQGKQEVHREIAWKGPASRFKCRVVRSIELKYNRVWHLCVMSDDSAVVCGERYGWCRLTHISLRDGERLGRLRMEEANGLTEIEHNGRIYLAIAYSKDRVIELYDVRDLRKTAHTYHVDPDRPGIMCTSSPYTLLYADSSKYVKPQDVTSLDCRTSRPVYKGTTHTRYPGNSDMCCVRDGDKSLLVTSYSHQGDEESGIYACNRRTDTLEWSIKGYLRGMEKRMSPHGVTTDGRGHLFVCDQQNACVQMFSTDGVYMGTVLRTRENGMFEPSLVRWSDRMSALIIVHQNREETWISVVNVQPSG